MMKFKHSSLLFFFLFGSHFFNVAEACWGTTAPNYGETSRDYDLLEGSELVINCSLSSHDFPDFPRPVNSSNLIFEKSEKNQSVLEDFTKRIDDLTIQLRLPNAKMTDAGLYLCKVILSNKTNPLICGTKVNIGYPPKPVTNFTCISRNFDNLLCSWKKESNGLATIYTIEKSFLNIPNAFQGCPNITENSCEWTNRTEPRYAARGKYINFTVKGTNSLGSSSVNFSLHEYSFVIPNKPERLEAIDVSNQFLTIQWKPPTMKTILNVMPMLEYEISVQKLFYNSSNVTVYDAGIDTNNFTIFNLLPHVAYNVSVRCRSVTAMKEDMWSSQASLVVKTIADVPYVTPVVIPEAYELHKYEDSRSISLYWKAVPELNYNGENFHYHIKYFQNNAPKNAYDINTNVPFVKIENLLKKASYSFHIYSANDIGLSEGYKAIIVDIEDNILPPLESITAISQDLGIYNLSWNSTSFYNDINYIVFWCSSLKPWQSRCDSPVEWSTENLTATSTILNLSDVKTNFQFAVASKTKHRSSGMQWASCIVPHKAALGKIRDVEVEQRNSTALRVIWKLDCDAQKAVVDKYEITYCRIHEDKICKVATIGPNAKSYDLQDLHPYSNYSVTIRAYNKDNQPSEDSDAVKIATLPGAPSGPPENVTVLSKSNFTFHVNWTPPSEPNGIITKYIVSYNGSQREIEVNPDQDKYGADISNLKPFTNYAVQIQACVSLDCSEKSTPVMIQTDVGEPGRMDPPRIEAVNSTHLKVSWKPPEPPNGPINFYRIEWHEEGQNVTSDVNEIIEVAGISSLFIDLKCSKLEDGGLKYLFYIRAANLKNGARLFGPLSEPTQATACIMSQGLAMIIGIAIGGTLALAFLLLLFYKLVKWMREKIHQVKSITIRLPKGLEGPETNPLNNYEYFKNGLNQNILPNSTERLSYIIDENDSKNRHGSGSSQFSNSSTDELIFKNGKCTKFGRKPSGDSSGCSSMSSNTTPRTHLSSDSGTESDFVVPPSPDSAITEQSHNSHKPPLPILMEVHDQSASEQQPSFQSFSLDKQIYKPKNTIDDMILKIDQPYSKFGMAGNPASSVPWRVNPLAFYSCNLANSEPSVFDVQKIERQNTVYAPYSKVGIAKSSGDILNIPSVKELGYSKLGFPTPQKRFTVPPVTVNPVATVKGGNSVFKENICTDKFLDNRHLNSDDACKVQPLNVSTEDLVGDCGYIKFGMNNICSQKSSPGYVPFSDLKGQQEHSPVPASVNPSDPKDFYNNSSMDVEFSDDLKWPSDNPSESEIKNEGIPEVLFNVPLSQKPLDGLLMEAGASNSDIYNFNLPSSGDSISSLHKVSSESDIKYSYSSPYSKVNHSFPNQSSDLPYTNHMSLPTKNSSFEESQPDGLCNPKTANYDIPNEVVINPVTLRKDYVPVSSLSDAVCDRTLSSLPNVPKSNSPHTVFPNGVCTEADNYVTPSNKGDLRLLRDDSFSKADSISPVKQRNSLNETKIPIQNGLGYINGSLKYILTPLPKMQSEICEV